MIETRLRSMLDEGTEKRPSQTRKATVLLREMVISNKLLPGSMHLESELAELLALSRTPVREAAIILEGQGLVEVIPRRGIKIVPLSVADMEEIYSILTELESLAAYDVARKGPEADDIAELRSHTDDMDAALKDDDRAAWAEADHAFHSKLVAMTGNRRLISIVATYSDQVHRARLLTLHMRPKPYKSNADHRALVDAIAAGEADRAREIHRDHRVAAKNLMIGLIATHGLSAL